MRTIAIVNQKGGCGKTTTAINLAAVFARDGKRTLLVDMDPQSHCAAGLGVPEKRVEYSIADALVERSDERIDTSRLVWEVARNLDLAPATMRLAALEAPGGGLHDMPEKDRRLERVLGRFAGIYDVCLIDCPPTIGLLTFNAMRGREALIPVETGYFALKGAQKQWETIQRVIRHIGRPIACHIVPTLHDPESELARDILVSLRRHFAGQIVPLVIREHHALREAASMGQPVCEYAPDSEAARDYDDLADWLREHDVRPCIDIEIVRRQEPRPGHEDPTTVPFAPHPVGATIPTPRTVSPAPANSTPTPPPTPAGRGDRAGELVRRLRARSPGTADTALAMQKEIREAISGGGATDRERSERSVSVPVPVSVPATVPASVPASIPIPIPTPDPPDLSHIYGIRHTSQGVLFVQPDPGEPMSLAGDFNDWMPQRTPLRPKPELGVAEALLSIPPGRYLYRLVVGGHWRADPYNEHCVINDHGESNSVLVVPEASHEPDP